MRNGGGGASRAAVGSGEGGGRTHHQHSSGEGLGGGGLGSGGKGDGGGGCGDGARGLEGGGGGGRGDGGGLNWQPSSSGSQPSQSGRSHVYMEHQLEHGFWSSVQKSQRAHEVLSAWPPQNASSLSALQKASHPAWPAVGTILCRPRRRSKPVMRRAHAEGCREVAARASTTRKSARRLVLPTDFTGRGMLVQCTYVSSRLADSRTREGTDSLFDWLMVGF